MRQDDDYTRFFRPERKGKRQPKMGRTPPEMREQREREKQKSVKRRR